MEAVKPIKQRFSFEDELFKLYKILEPTKILNIGAISLLQRFYRDIVHRHGIKKDSVRRAELTAF